MSFRNTQPLSLILKGVGIMNMCNKWYKYLDRPCCKWSCYTYWRGKMHVTSVLTDRRLAQGRQKLLRHFRRGSGHNLSFRHNRSFKLMRPDGGGGSKLKCALWGFDDFNLHWDALAHAKLIFIVTKAQIGLGELGSRKWMSQRLWFSASQCFEVKDWSLQMTHVLFRWLL